MFNFWTLYFYIYWHIRSLVKWFLRRTTKYCELQRICYGKPSGFARSHSVEYSLINSKSSEIQMMVGTMNRLADDRKFIGGRNQKTVLEQAVRVVLLVKRIDPKLHRQFVISFSRCIEHIWGYRQLMQEIETLRLTQYESWDIGHETKLTRLWDALMPQVPLESRITKQWQEIGFQGDDPKTDFRGMGMLGLENLLFFAEEYTNAARHVQRHSVHPQYGYAFAIVGINLTSMAYNLLKDGSAKTHVYNTCRSIPSLRVFHHMYSYLFYEFDKFWLESKPRDVMEFSFIKDKFEINIRDILSNPSTVFRINFVVNNV